ncbi:MAG: exosortase/archaeosortase family protein [Nitrospira sp.]|nr:MAG: exosortase/archaeosortase family protein [Nitrospira sp.]
MINRISTAVGQVLERDSPWSQAGPGMVGLLLVGGLLVGLYYKTLGALGMDWYSDPDFSHGFLVPIMSGYFVWERWAQLKNQVIEPSLSGLPVLCLGLGMLVLGSLGAELYLQRSSLIVVLCGLVWVLLGRIFLKSLALPLAFLLFMIPLPSILLNTITFPLQLFAAKVATICLFTLSIPVLREGNIIMLTGTTLEVAEACSGIRSLQALLALGTVYAYFTQETGLGRWTLVLLSVPIAIAANVIRVSGTGILAEHYGAEAAQGFYHIFEGWIVFVVAFIFLLGAGSVLSRILSRRAVTGAHGAPDGHSSPRST